MALIDATPWTPRQMLNMYDRQAANWLPPYTCGGGGGPCSGVSLIVTRDGLRCPTCSRLQRNAHDVDLDGEFPESPFAPRSGAAEPAERWPRTVEYTIEVSQRQSEQLFAVADRRDTTVGALLHEAIEGILAADE